MWPERFLGLPPELKRADELCVRCLTALPLGAGNFLPVFGSRLFEVWELDD